MPEAVGNILILDYGSPEALAIIKDRGKELAAVLVEPVQSRNPSLQPREFLHELRKLTTDLRDRPLLSMKSLRASGSIPVALRPTSA